MQCSRLCSGRHRFCMCVLCGSVVCVCSVSSSKPLLLVDDGRGAVLAMSTSREFFDVETCPALNECSSSSWKHAAVWGWTEDECRSQLFKHLTNSNKHSSMPASDRKQLVAGVDLIADVYQMEKRGRGEESAGSGGPQLAIGAGSGGPHRHDEEEQAIVSEMELAQLALDQEDHVGGVILRQVEFDSMIDSVTRASSCAKSAQRLAASAAKAFSDEVASLEAVRAHLQRIKENAEGDMRL